MGFIKTRIKKALFSISIWLSHVGIEISMSKKVYKQFASDALLSALFTRKTFVTCLLAEVRDRG